MLGIDPQTAFMGMPGAARAVVGLDDGPELPPLGRGVEYDMIRQLKQLSHFLPAPGRGKGMHLAAEFLPAQARLIPRGTAHVPQSGPCPVKRESSGNVARRVAP